MFSSNRRVRSFALFVSLIVAVTPIAFGQAITGTILGRVTDSTGAVMAGAKIQILNLGTGFMRSEETDDAGRYLSSNLPLGDYSVTVQRAGFQSQERRGIALSVGSEITVNMELSVGNIQEKVEVTAAALAIETTNASISALVSSQQVRDLPLNTRSVDQLALMTPGVYVDPSAKQSAGLGMGTHLSVNGSRLDATLYLLDGTVTNDQSGGGPGSAAGNMLGVESILEFRFLSHNFSAEYGRVGGSVLSLVTRSGTNQFHGSVYEFLRNTDLNARNFFNIGDLPPYHRNQFGAAVGGPIKKDHIFFFTNYEGLRQIQYNPVNIPVPDLNARQGLLPCATIPTAVCNPTTGLASTTLNPAVVPFMNLYPLPNGPEISGGTAQYRGSAVATSNEDYAMQRLDVRASDKDNVFLRYVYNPSRAVTPAATPTFAGVVATSEHFLVLSESHILSATSLNDFRIAFNRSDPTTNDLYLTPQNAAVTLVPGTGFGRIQFSTIANALGQLPVLGVDGNRAPRVAQNLYQESDTYSTVRGAHSLKFGVDVERIQININNSGNQVKGTEQFGGLAAFLAGTPTSISVTPAGPNIFERGFRSSIVGIFVQDDYRIRPNLTLNLGLREDLFTSPTEVNGLIGDLINPTDSSVTRGHSYFQPWKAFAPRAGLAWDPFGDGKTAVRIGAGLYYNPMVGRDFDTAAYGNPLFINALTITNPPFPYALVNGAPTTSQAVVNMQYHVDNPTVAQYNVEVQRQLTRTVSVHVGYIASSDWHLLRQVQLNTQAPQILANGSLFWTGTTPKLNPNFSTITAYRTDARANYNGMQATIQQSLAAGLQFQLTYTWSKAMSNADAAINAVTAAAPNSTMNQYNLAQDYSLSVYDQRQAVRMNGSYELPFAKWSTGGVATRILGGWSINGIYTYGSGLPFTVTDGFNNSKDGDTNNPDRPNLNPGFAGSLISGVTAGCPGVAAGQRLRTPGLWFDPCAFSLSPAGTFGNLGRDTIVGPGLNNIDAAVMKTTSINERFKLQFRAEVFNLFNHALFALPTTVAFTSARTLNGSVGSITSTIKDNREMQLGLKLIF